jgi:hypothetical protein
VVAAAAVLKIFGGGRVCVEEKPLFCRHCDFELWREYRRLFASALITELLALLENRQARIIEQKWPDGRKNWGCNSCGRAVKASKETRNKRRKS